MKKRNCQDGRRRFLQMGLRSFLIASVMTGLLSGALYSSSSALLRDWSSVSALERKGAVVESDFHRRYGLFPPARKGKLAPLLEWASSKPYDVNLTRLQDLQADKALEQVTALSHVHSLNLCSSDVTNEGLKQLGDIPGLKHLVLTDTSIDDDGLVNLRQLTELRRLDLSDTAISDDGLFQLALMPWLDEVLLDGTNLSADAKKALQNSCPGTRFQFELQAPMSTAMESLRVE